VDQQQCDRISAWFDEYTAGFYGENEYVNANIRLKDRHSRRVCGEIVRLAQALGLSENQKRIARALGLLHDVGRFEQFRKYKTYNDLQSVNHCMLGVEILREKGILRDLDAGESEIIERAVEYHGLKQLPEGLPDKTLLFARMIRDADKLDVFHIVAKYQKIYEQDPEKFMLEIELADEPTCTPEIVEAILAGELIDYARLRTLHDMRLMQLGWVYDVNFPQTLERILWRQYCRQA
jgi:response regulator RpfG family c-di-GMP phosphodiesterase